MSKYEIYYKEVEELNKKGYRNYEIGKILNLDARRIPDILKKLNLTRNNSYDMIKLTAEEESAVIGNIIGDGCIFKDKKASHYRMNLAHSLHQKEYFMKKYKMVKRLVNNDPKERKWIDKRTNKEYGEIRYQTISNEIFNKYYDIWYKNNKKIIPIDEINKIDIIALSIKYYDDGYCCREAGNIAMNDYDIESIENFRSLLKNKFNIATTLQKNKSIYIPKKEFKRFREIVRPFATSDVLYKLGEFGGTLTK
jgi:hypothetical protein